MGEALDEMGKHLGMQFGCPLGPFRSMYHAISLVNSHWVPLSRVAHCGGDTAIEGRNCMVKCGFCAVVCLAYHKKICSYHTLYSNDSFYLLAAVGPGREVRIKLHTMFFLLGPFFVLVLLCNNLFVSFSSEPTS